MNIKNIKNLSKDQINHELKNGGKFVVFQYCFSILIMTFERSSDVYFIRPDENSGKFSIKYTIFTLFAGWWGFPWGPIYTIRSIFRNLKGGNDVTAEVLGYLNNS